ncbi:MAG: YdcF family protein [Eubacterium sp.]|jgi:vancomycin permeability regulator SanA|nr:YdcF family protein [Eubacterium sp.]
MSIKKMKQNKKHPICKRILLTGGALALLGCLCVLGLNLWVTISTSSQILEFSEDNPLDDEEKDHDCIVILGAGLRGNEPSPMLRDRLNKGISCYQNGVAPKILMSGDHGRDGYNEVQVMKQYAVSAGVPSQDIFMDHAGFSTYDSMVRAHDIFGLKNPVIVTQEYHIYRALFIGNNVGLDCTGIPTDYYKYGGQPYRIVREYIARCKDVGTVLLGAEPIYRGEPISITGNGDVTNEER